MTSCAHTKKGRRNHVSPGARSCTIVVIVLTDPNSADTISRNIPTSQNVCPSVAKSARADLQRDEVVAKRADRQRDDRKEHHDGAVHADQRVVELGKHHAARRVQLTEPASDHRYGLTGIGELPPKENCEREANQEKDEAGQRVLEADDLLIRREERAKRVWIL